LPGQVQLKMKRYELSMADKDIESGQAEEVADFESNQVYKVFPLIFGGYIAFEPELIHCYKRKIKTKIVSKRLKNPMQVTAICLIDQYDP
jgi:hypothetical protein